MKRNKGFTLIELLVVIAIIGILSAIVLAELNTARSRAKDATVQGQMSNARAQAEIYYGSNTAYPHTYTGVCLAGANSIYVLLSASASSTNTTVGSTDGTQVNCNESSSGDAWAAEAPLTTGTPQQYWCVDSTGKSGQESATLSTRTTCL